MDIISLKKAKVAEQKADSVQEQLNQAVQDGDQLAETQQARVDEKGNPHATLKDRLDAEKQETDQKVQSLTTQLAQTTNVVGVSVESFSHLVVDGDWSNALQQAGNLARESNLPLICPQHIEMRLYSPVNLRFVRNIRLLGNIYSHVEGVAITVGNDSVYSMSVPVEIFIASVLKEGATNEGDIAVRIVGLKNAKVTILNAYYVQLYADASDRTMSSIAYSEFHFGRQIETLELYGEAGGSWINENSFYGGRYTKIILDAVDYHHNNNVFYKPCVESNMSTPNTSSIQVLKGVRNQFKDVRSENGLSVSFGEETSLNIVDDAFVSNRTHTRGSATVVSDLGFENFVVSTKERLLPKRSIATLDRSSLIFNETGENIAETSTALFPITSGLDYLRLTNTHRNIFDTGVFELGTVRRFEMESDAGLWRPRVWCFDENMNPLTGDDPMYIESVGVINSIDDYYQPSQNRSELRLVFSNPNVKYARILIRSGSEVGAFRHLSLNGFSTPSVGDRVIEQLKKAVYRPLAQATAPTRGVARVGQVVTKLGGEGDFKCVFRSDGKLNDTYLGEESVVTLTVTTSISSGDIIGILLDDRTTHWTTITAKSGYDMTIADPLPSPAKLGNDVIVLRWSQPA